MSKELLVDPSITRSTGELKISAIPLNKYVSDINAERSEHGDAALLRIGRDMILVREFELMLDSIKREGSYRGIDYVHAGPAHLSIGQEAAAVGQAFTLGIEDKVFGSHRSHGEVIAKGLSAITSANSSSTSASIAMPDLLSALKAWSNGAIWEVVSARLPDDDPEQQAINYLLYGLTAETFGRRTGFNRGLGGSMHAFFPPLGIYPNNAIVGGSAPLATGAALHNRLRALDGIVVASIGDAATGRGPVLESFNFAGMAQLNGLMDPKHSGGLPIIFFVVNNFYGMGGQTIGETMAYDQLSRLGAGFNKFNLHAETVDGNNPLAVIRAMTDARRHLVEGTGPVLLDVQTYRRSGHSPSDASSYRSKDEMDLWSAVDPIDSYFSHLVDGGVITASHILDLKAWAEESVTAALQVAIDEPVSSRLELKADPEVMARITFSNTMIDLAAAPLGETLMPLEEVSRVKSLAKKSRAGIVDGVHLSGAKAITFRDALFEAIAHHAAADDRVTIWGEENRDWDGAFGVYRGLTEFLPRHRLFNTPISESTIVGAGVGYALTGGRPVVELMYADFIGCAGDEIFNQMAKWRAMSGGLVELPMVLRVSVGSKYGAQHSQDWSSMVALVPGLKVAFPATPRDAKGMLSSALSGNDPVVFFESQRLYDQTEVVYDEVPTEYYRTEIGTPSVARVGEDLTIMTVGAALYRALEAAKQLEARYHISVEVIDARSMVPFDYTLLIASVAKTGRLLLASDANLRGSWLHTVASRVSMDAFDELDAPVVVLGARNWIAPPAELEWQYFVTSDDIIDAVHSQILPLPGHQVQPGSGAQGSQLESSLGI